MIHEYAEEFDLDLRQSFAYGNEMSDAKMLEAVGHPAAVNASRSLEREARKRGWRVYSWCDSRGERCELRIVPWRQRKLDEALRASGGTRNSLRR